MGSDLTRKATGLATAGGYIVAGPYGAAIGLGLAYAGYTLFASSPESVPVPPLDQNYLTLYASPSAPLPVVYGQTMLGGLLAHVEVSDYTMTVMGVDFNVSNGRLHLITALCEGEIEEITSVHIDVGDEIIDSDDSSLDLVDGVTISGDDNRYVVIEKHTGADDQAADSDAVSMLEDWTSAHKLSGVAYVHTKLLEISDGYADELGWRWSGIPEIRHLVKGRKVYDPRIDDTVWSENPALCIRDYLTNARFGRGIDESLIDDDTITAAANYCETQVDVPDGDGGTVEQDRYTCNGVLDTAQPVLENIRRLLSCCRGWLVFTGGKYRLLIDQTGSSTYSFDEDNMVGPLDIEMGSKSTQLNRIRARFFNPDEDYAADYVVPDSAALRTTDNELLLEREIDLPFTNNAYTALHLGNIEVNQSRQQIAVRFKTFIEGLLVECGDVIDITHDTPGWTGAAANKEFRVLNMRLLPNDEVEITALEYDADVYNYGSINTVDNTENTNLPDPNEVGMPGAPEIAESLYQTRNSAGVKLRLTITWGDSDSAYLAGYQLEWKLSSDTDWTVEHQVTTASIVIDDFMDSTTAEEVHGPPGTFDFRVAAVTHTDVFSDYAYTNNYTVDGLYAEPSDPTGENISWDGTMLCLRWDLPDPSTDLDVIIGGAMYVRHSDVIGSPDWDDDFSGIQYATHGNQNFMVIPWLAGSYMLRFYDAQGIGSVNYVTVDTEGFVEPEGYDTSDTAQEDPTFGGVHTNTEVSGSDLRLQTGNTSGLYAWSLLGGGSEAVIDLTTSRECRLTIDIAAQLVARFSNIDDRTENMDSWPDFDGLEGAAGSTATLIWGTDDDPTSSPSWTYLGVLTTGVYEYRAYKLATAIDVNHTDYNIEVDQLRVNYEYNASGLPFGQDAGLIGGLSQADTVVVSSATKYLTTVGVNTSLTELNHVSGVTSGIQTQIDAKLDRKDPWSGDLALVGDAVGDGRAVESSVTATELGHLSGADSNIQDQIDALSGSTPRAGFLLMGG